MLPTATAGRRTRPPAGSPPRPDPEALRAEAHRLARRRCRAAAAVRRLGDHPDRDRLARLAAHSERLHVALHRTLARLRAVAGPEEAQALRHAYREELARGMARGPAARPAGAPASRPCPAERPVPGAARRAGASARCHALPMSSLPG